MKKALVLYYSMYGHIEQMADYDAIIVGTPTRFGNMAGQMRTFLDRTGGLWAQGNWWANSPCGAATIAGSNGSRLPSMRCRERAPTVAS